MTSVGDAVASCVLQTFEQLPKKFKPRSYDNGVQEWVPLSGIVLAIDRNGAAQQEGNCDGGATEGDEELHCVALG